MANTFKIRSQLPSDDRADICAANLHSVDVATKYYVAAELVAECEGQSNTAGDFVRGLGKSTRIVLKCRYVCALILAGVVYNLFSLQFRQTFEVPVDYRGIAFAKTGSS